MAKIEYDSFINNIHGRMGDAVHYNFRTRKCMRIYVVPRNPGTELQQKNRALFAEAMASWKTLTPEEKYYYRKRTRKLAMHPHNLYIREYMKAHSAVEGTAAGRSPIINRYSIHPTSLQTLSEASPYQLRDYPFSPCITEVFMTGSA